MVSTYRLRNVLYQLRCFGRYATVVAAGLVDYLKNSDKLTAAVKATFAELLHEPTNVSPSDPSAPPADPNIEPIAKPTPAPAPATTPVPKTVLPGVVDIENSAVMVLDKLLKTSAAQRPKNARALARFVTSVARVPDEMAGLVMYVPPIVALQSFF